MINEQGTIESQNEQTQFENKKEKSLKQAEQQNANQDDPFKDFDYVKNIDEFNPQTAVTSELPSSPEVNKTDENTGEGRVYSPEPEYSNIDFLIENLYKEAQEQVTELEQELNNLTQTHSAERSNLEEKLQTAQAQVNEYEKFKEKMREFQKNIVPMEKEYNSEESILQNEKSIEEQILNRIISIKNSEEIKTKDTHIATLQKELNNLTAELAEKTESTESDVEMTEPETEKNIVSTKQNILPEPKKLQEDENAFETEEADITTKLLTATSKITDLKKQIQIAQETHSAAIKELQNKLQEAQNQITEYEDNKKIAQELLDDGREATKMLDKNLKKLRTEASQITDRYNAIEKNSQDTLIATLTNEVNKLRAQAGKEPLPHAITIPSITNAKELSSEGKAKKKRINLSGLMKLSEEPNEFGYGQEYQLLGIKQLSNSIPKLNLAGLQPKEQDTTTIIPSTTSIDENDL